MNWRFTRNIPQVCGSSNCDARAPLQKEPSCPPESFAESSTVLGLAPGCWASRRFASGLRACYSVTSPSIGNPFRKVCHFASRLLLSLQPYWCFPERRCSSPACDGSLRSRRSICSSHTQRPGCLCRSPPAPSSPGSESPNISRSLSAQPLSGRGWRQKELTRGTSVLQLHGLLTAAARSYSHLPT